MDKSSEINLPDSNVLNSKINHMYGRLTNRASEGAQPYVASSKGNKSSFFLCFTLLYLCLQHPWLSLDLVVLDF